MWADGGGGDNLAGGVLDVELEDAVDLCAEERWERR
jgi:hypothetical protein